MWLQIADVHISVKIKCNYEISQDRRCHLDQQISSSQGGMVHVVQWISQQDQEMAKYQLCGLYCLNWYIL